MDQPVRIALAGIEGGRLLEQLRALPLQPETHVYGSLYDNVEELLGLRPDVLFVGAAPEDGDLAGALRVLHRLLPALAVVLVAPAGREVQLAALRERTAANVLVTPSTAGQVAATLEQALTRSDRPGGDVFLDLAHGFADEVNNPLLHLTGHLQLLLAQLDPQQDAARREQIAAALAGGQRIQAAVDRIHLAARAAGGPRQREPVDLRALLASALAGLPARPAALHCTFEPDGEQFVVPGDPELLRPALLGLLQVGSELRELGCTVQCSLSRFPAAARLRLAVAGSGLQHWHLPRTFEPYYLNRFLRGSPQGLALFVAQAVVHGHGGQATCRRLPDDRLALDLALPVA